MKDSFKLSCDLVRCPDTSFLKLIPNHCETKMAVVVGGAGGGGGTVFHRVWIFGSHRYTPSKNFTEYLPRKVHQLFILLVSLSILYC